MPVNNNHLLLLFLLFVTSTLQTLYEAEYRLGQIEKTLEEIKVEISKISTKCDDGRRFPKNCQTVLEEGNGDSGVYTIKPPNSEKEFQVYCDLKTRGGGWVYIMNRFDGSQDFYLTWENYKNGFGNLSGEFWLGLEYFHKLTNSEDNEMLVELVSWNDTKKAKYDYIKIGSESEGYSIKILGRYKGDAGDSLVYYDRMKFTTKDRDNDLAQCTNCARSKKAAWWYSDCFHGQLTGLYLNQTLASRPRYGGIIWYTFPGGRESLKEARIMIRPRNNLKK